MTTETAQRRVGGTGLPCFVDAEILAELPMRRPATSAEGSSCVQWSLVDIDRYEVRRSGGVLGYIDVVGAVYVALSGPRGDRAEEISQTLVFEHAVGALEARAATSEP